LDIKKSKSTTSSSSSSSHHKPRSHIVSVDRSLSSKDFPNISSSSVGSDAKFQSRPIRKFGGAFSGCALISESDDEQVDRITGLHESYPFLVSHAITYKK